MLASRGLMIPPCGVPVRVSLKSSLYITPARRNFQIRSLISLSATLFLITFNWLRVSDTAERSQVDQRIGQQLHAIVALLDVFKAEQQPLALIFPRKGPLDPHPQ